MYPLDSRNVYRFHHYRSNEKNIIASLLKFAGHISNHKMLPGNYVHPTGGVDILFLLFPPSTVRRPVSGVRRPTWFPDILGNSSYPIFTKFGMQVYWVNSLYGIAFGDDSSIAN